MTTKFNQKNAIMKKPPPFYNGCQLSTPTKLLACRHEGMGQRTYQVGAVLIPDGQYQKGGEEVGNEFGEYLTAYWHEWLRKLAENLCACC